MKLLLMGAGYVGMPLLEKLKSQSHELYITTTKESKINTLSTYGKTFYLNELTPNDFKVIIAQCEGAIILVAPKDSHKYKETYLETAKKITSALSDSPSPFYIIYTSSTSVYEGYKNEIVTEETPLNPISENPKILYDTECCYLNSPANVCILRLGGIFGPNRELYERAKRFSGLEIPGSGNEPTNHIHLEDILLGIQHCLKNNLSGVYNLVNEDHRTRKELYSNLCHKLGIPLPKWNNLPSEKNGGYIVSNEKIKNTGFSFQHALAIE